MGMLDKLERFDQHFQEGQVFTLQDAKLGPEIKTDYGTDRPAQFKIGGKWFSIFGVGLRNQVERMDDEDRRAMKAGQFECKLVRTQTRNNQEVKVLVSPDFDPDKDDIPF
jgi:hypothetical protein